MLSKIVLAVAACNISMGEKVLFMDQTVPMTYNGQAIRWTPPDAYDRDEAMQPDAKTKTLFNEQDNFMPWKLRERHSDFEPDAKSKTSIKSIEITQTYKDSPSVFKPKAGDVDESYSLTVSEDGKVAIKAKSSTGVLYGLESFSQLFKHSAGTFWYTPNAPVSIEDEPRFPHRGVLLDVARSFLGVDDIKRTIDAMAWSKLNRLHLHVTDSQSWPLEIPALPELAEKGACHRGLSYSPQDVKDLYEYGIPRGVEVVLEIDMPGHIGVLELAYKDLIVAYDAKPYDQYCAEPPCGAFRLNSTAVYSFLDTLFGDLFPRIAPYTAYFHTGGDELKENDSNLDPDIRSNDTKVLSPLLQKFVSYTHEKVRTAGLTPLVWEEMVTTWNLTIGSDVLVQSWLGGSAVKDLAEGGRKVIDSNYEFWYLDCGRGQWLNFANGDTFKKYYPFNDWCGPTKSWQLVYAHDPLAGISKNAVQNVLGGEVAVWTETIDAVNLDTLVWPRASVAGEVLWSGRQDAAGQNRSQYDAMPRLAEFRERLVARGLRTSPIQMTFCTQGNVTKYAA
ncbi:uncharacterized protein NECHADRAFT_105798 [Fusarium vanettenii 77-13-4]|uniref:Beta-hexosaminidase n=1 Tax=Fusarium vanettenii (strain ATCC MYA-4622 / CBS 123669 / FGSC 9596 / NRRL 45880 / 77-13-4) TaxID=660122 RepID=C7ZRJ5_FUSV7|nr:uncharacterized protein NECHADRAFT_105798 [Fusarium vanettenii 77-13-4]EEU33364.1 hypothetical protein NECHADRAFT_105798 [Fusarium vanettenii 77-13-4]